MKLARRRRCLCPRSRPLLLPAAAARVASAHPQIPAQAHAFCMLCMRCRTQGRAAAVGLLGSTCREGSSRSLPEYDRFAPCPDEGSLRNWSAISPSASCRMLDVYHCRPCAGNMGGIVGDACESMTELTAEVKASARHKPIAEGRCATLAISPMPATTRLDATAGDRMPVLQQRRGSRLSGWSSLRLPCCLCLVPRGRLAGAGLRLAVLLAGAGSLTMASFAVRHQILRSRAGSATGAGSRLGCEACHEGGCLIVFLAHACTYLAEDEILQLPQKSHVGA